MNNDFLSMALSGLFKKPNIGSMPNDITGGPIPPNMAYPDYSGVGGSDAAAMGATPGPPLGANPMAMPLAKFGAGMMGGEQGRSPFEGFSPIHAQPYMAPQNSLMSPMSFMTQKPGMGMGRPGFGMGVGGRGRRHPGFGGERDFNPDMLGGRY